MDADRFPDSMTLGEVRALLRVNLRKGIRCPACTQFTKIYRRPMNGKQGRALIIMYRRFGLQFGHAPSVLPARDNGMLALLRYWDLVEEHPDQREDGGHSGWWRVTGLGERFIKEQVEVPKYAVIFDSKLLRLDGSTTVGIREVLGTKFDLEELMSS